MRKICLGTLLLATLIRFEPRSARGGNDLIQTASPPSAVSAFDLCDVHLLEGPFKQAMDRNAEYLLQLDPDRFLHYFRAEAGLNPKAPAYPAWESPDEGAGRCLGHYLSALSLQYRASGDSRFKQRVAYLIDELSVVQQANGDGYLGAEAHGKQFWAELAAGKGDALKKHRVPWYIQHKMFAGLRDAYQNTGNEKAKSVLVRCCDWAIHETEKLDDHAFAEMLEQEHGGMREVLCDVYTITGEVKYLALAKRFYHARVMDPLAAGQDDLAGLHANTQIPKLIGEARWYELTGDLKNQQAARFFWDTVVRTRTYANGGNSDAERFDRAGELANHLGISTSETCNTYNMLKLTSHLFEWEPRVEYADYVERALFNHMLASIGPEPGNYTYYLPMKSGHYRTFSEPQASFWCCVGTGMENHTKYGGAIYYHDAVSIYVNQFIPSVLNWNGLTLRQETDYPQTGKITFILSGKISASLVLRIRYPAWAAHGATLILNGQPLTTSAEPGNYISIDRPWNSGDRLELSLPLSLRTEPLPEDLNRVAVFYGPVLLCGQRTPVKPEQQLLKDSPQSGGKDEEVEPLKVGGRPIQEWVVPTTKPLHFCTSHVGLVADLNLAPFYEQTGRRYIVYWQTVN